MASLNSFLNNPILVLIAPITIFFLIVFVWFRAGTVVTLLERVWRLVAGKLEISDTKLIKFSKELRDIEQFNFVYGLKVKSLGQMHQVIEWIEKHKLGFVDVRSAKKWIDVETMTIQLPNKSYIRRRFVGFMVFAILLMLASYPIGLKSALLQFKDSKTWILLDNNKAEGLINDWILGPAECNALQERQSVATELTENEKEIICQSFKDKEMTKYLENTLHTQRLLFGFISLILLLSMIAIAKKINSYQVANNLKEILEREKKSLDAIK